MDSLGELGSLVSLEVLDASRNKINDMKEMSVMLKCWPRLVTLDLVGNPLCSKNKYRERIIVLAPNIRTLDGKEIQELSRKFLQNWKLSKEMINSNLATAAVNNPIQRSLDRNDADIIDVFQPANTNNSALYRNGAMKNINAIPTNTYIMPGNKSIIFKKENLAYFFRS